MRVFLLRGRWEKNSASDYEPITETKNWPCLFPTQKLQLAAEPLVGWCGASRLSRYNELMGENWCRLLISCQKGRWSLLCTTDVLLVMVADPTKDWTGLSYIQRNCDGGERRHDFAEGVPEASFFSFFFWRIKLCMNVSCKFVLFFLRNVSLSSY